MNLWMSIPSVAFQNYALNTSEGALSTFHIRCSKSEMVENLLVRPSTDLKKMLAIYALSALIKGEKIDWIPDVFIGCNTSLDKELSIADLLSCVDWANLPMTVLDCSDLIQAFNYLPMIEHSGGEEAILLTIQRDSQFIGTSLSKDVLGNAAGAVGFSCRPDRFGRSFQILSFAQMQVAGNCTKACLAIIDNLLSDANCKQDSVRWIIAQKSANSLAEIIKKRLPSATFSERESNSKTNYGCVDILISLESVFVTQRLPPRGNGIVWYIGEGETLGAIMLNSDSVSLWNRYTSEKPPYI